MDNTNETNNTELTITTINVNDLNSSQKRNKIFNWLKSQKIVITLIQETHSIHSVQQHEIQNTNSDNLSRRLSIDTKI